MKQKMPEGRDAALDGEEVQQPAEHIRRTVHGDLGVETHDDRVGVMPAYGSSARPWVRGAP